MKCDEFIKHVQSIAQFGSRDEAESAIRATLETRRERLVNNEAKYLASQLPSEFGQYLRGREGENGQPFSLKEFYQRVSQKESVAPVRMATHARAVFSALNIAVELGEMQDVISNFSPDYKDLFLSPIKRG